jgi:hypothetical protein
VASRLPVRALLGERPRRALGLEELAALERAARGVGQVDRELEIVVGQLARLGEEDEHEPSVPLPGRFDRGREQRAGARAGSQRVPFRVEPVVLRDRRGGEDPALRGGGRERLGGARQSAAELRRELWRQLMGARELERARPWHQDGRGGAAERLRRRLGDRVERRGEGERLP